LWETSRPANLFDDRTIILAVDVVASRPNVTITEEGDVRCLKNLMPLDDPDLTTEFLTFSRLSEKFTQSDFRPSHPSCGVAPAAVENRNTEERCNREQFRGDTTKKKLNNVRKYDFN
jgi:hypothetical protein